MEAQKSQWSRHVMQDFEPYFCIHDDCRSPFDIPNNFNGLLKHLQEDHVEERFHVEMPNGNHEEVSETRKYGVTKLIDFYGAGNAGAVFLTLVYIDADHEIWKILYKEAFTDVRLPVTKVDNRDDEVRSIKRDGTANPFQTKLLTKPSTWSTRTWDEFLKNQWLFVVPVFREAQFAYEFAFKCRLPFVDIKDGKIHRGHFGTVYQLGLRPDHTDFAGSSAVHVSQEGYIEVGLKVMTIEQTDTTDTDVEKFYNKEKETLKTMRDLKHRHLITAFAAYKREHFRCFIFPWASGGNLDSFWKHNSSKLDGNLVTWAVNQMSGISDGIEKLHGAHIRHGDIKPLNILFFSESGNLVVADVGLAKVHETYTKDREPGTTTNHGTNKYEPPEMNDFSRKATKISQKYDIWSLGCMFLEFTIWLLYGQGGLGTFQDKLQANGTGRLWVQTSRGYDLHRAVKLWIAKLKSQLDQNGVLGKLVWLISGKLLVPVDDRYTAKELAYKMRAIQTQLPIKGLNDLGPGLELLAKQRSGNMPESQADQELVSPSDAME
ncbi:Serine/threonine-protein kinase [Colletotrichum sp. SAR 10_77]|nr:Serine/threonine-protein kinase [Colletotrichum sp. SAR 10_77]